MSDGQVLTPHYDPGLPPWYFVSDLLALARERGTDGPVAGHLVGASLQSRFPDHQIRNTSSCASDVLKGGFGDFDVGETVFHVTVSPMPTLFKKCAESLEDGKSVYIVTLFRHVPGTFLAAAHYEPGRISVTSIEEFVSQILDWMSEFTIGQSKSRLKDLLETYNHRVDAVEVDKSLLIKLPANLG